MAMEERSRLIASQRFNVTWGVIFGIVGKDTVIPPSLYLAIDNVLFLMDIGDKNMESLTTF